MDWREQGNCQGHEINIFYEIYEENPKVRKVVDQGCRECPVRSRCFAEGVSNKEWGVWAGIYLEEGQISPEFNDHKTKQDWQDTWVALTMETK